MKEMIVRGLLYIFIAMVPVACGTRSAKISKYQSSVTLNEESKESGQKVDASKREDKSVTVTNKDISDEYETETTTSEWDNPEPGKPNRQTVTKTKGRKTDKGNVTDQKDTRQEDSSSVNWDIWKVHQAQQDISVKDKEVKADKSVAGNLGGAWVVIVIAVLVLVFFWFKR